MVRLKVKPFLYGVGTVASKVMELTLNVMFWLSIALLSVTWALVVYLTHQVKKEPRLIGVVAYIVIGFWLGASLLDGGVMGESRLPSGF